jgi:hypothetical protein
MADHTVPPPGDEVPVTPDEMNDAGQTPGQGDGSTPDNVNADDLGPRLERLGGEPAPDITPEEFARLQQAGQIHIDPRGRVRTTQRDETDAGISLRKRRAWYAAL